MSQEISLENSIYSVCADCPDCGEHQREPAMQCLSCGTMLVKGLRSGTVIADRYEYIEPIGSGGMGLIVKAADRTTGKEVAVKLLLHNESAADNRRFQVEAKAASMLTHKHIIHVLDFGLWDGHSPYMVMDYVVGHNLDNVIAKKGSLEVIETLEIFDQICDAMAYAHSKKIVHRDLKPSNIMLTGNNQDFVKIVDFGIAKILDKTTLEKSLTQTGQLIGSPLYMSPEQAGGNKVDVRTDIYSAGCVLYHALSGAPPLEGKTTIETLFMHLHDVPPSMSEVSLGKKFDPRLEEIVAKTLRKNPHERYQSFEELRADLEKSYSDGNQAPREVVAPQTERSKAAIVGGVFALCLIAGGGGYYFINAHQQQLAAAYKNAKAGNNTLNSVPAIDPKALEQAIKAKSGKEDPGTSSPGLENLGSKRPHDLIERDLKLGRGELNLNICNPKMDNEDVGYLVGRLNNVTSPIKWLRLSNANIDNVAVLSLSKLKNVRELDLGHTHIDGSALDDLAQMSSLQELHLTGLNVKGKDLSALAKLKKLKRLDLSMCNQLRGEECAFLSKLDLDLLYLNADFDIGEMGMRYVATQHDLSTLSLADARNIPASALRYLKDLRSLQTLDLTGITLSAKEFSYLSQLPNLINLNVSDCSLTPDGFQSLKSLSKLKILEIRNLRVSAKPLDPVNPVDNAKPLTSKQENELKDALNTTSVSTELVQDNKDWINKEESVGEPKLRHDGSAFPDVKL